MNCETEKEWERSLWIDMRFYLQDNMLTKVDRASMLNSLEVRIPFLDHKLVNFVLKIPAKFKYRGTTSKYVLKKICKNILPKNIVNRPKKGFGIPVSKWFKDDEYFTSELLNDKNNHDIFNRDYIKLIIHEHKNNLKDNRKLLWTLFTFQQWLSATK